jgi:tripartite ATP-independent transporter DctM subunit
MLESGIGLLILIGLLLAGVPVAFAFAVGVVFMIFALGYDPSFLLPYSFDELRTLVLAALIFYILIGGIMEKAGMSKSLIDFVDSVVSRVRGGLGAVGCVTCGIFGAISGTASGAIACIVPIIVPRMVEQGYPRGYAVALITGAAGAALVIPPSIFMVMYGWLTWTSITACFLAGVLPGILLVLLLIVFNWIMVGRLPTVKKPRPWGSVKQVGREVVDTGWRALPALLMPILILGSIFAGIVTPTESAAVGVFYAILVGFFVYRALTPKLLANTLIENSALIGSIILMLFGAVMIGRMWVMEGIPAQVTAFVLGISENKYVILLMVNAVLIFLGMFLDDSSALVIGTILLFPIVEAIGISPVHFSAIVCTNITMGCFTPPMAPLLFIGQRVGKVTFAEMFKPSMLMVVCVYLPVVLITTYWPLMSLWLPELILGSRVVLPL